MDSIGIDLRKEQWKMNIVLWLAFGALAGWIASMILSRDSSMGALANVVVGVVGAGLGGWIASLFGLGGVDGFNLYSLLIAVGGAVLLLWIVGMIWRHSRA
jgi:uncharacterized membrane protein YeaQ/YmgE (transglycosylase-associated protein family)